jgi:AcrR family transcriptional regulator
VSPSRRASTESSETRTLLVDATEALMLREGYAAVTSRRVAAEAGVTPPLVHYYFATLDDLFLAVLRRRADEHLKQQDEQLTTDQPLHALWAYSSDPAVVTFTTEFMALANHRKAIRGELAAYIDRFRDAQIKLLEAAERDGRIDLGGMSAAALVATLANAARGLAMEKRLGSDSGHREAAVLVDAILTGSRIESPRIEPTAQRRGKRPRSA